MPETLTSEAWKPSRTASSRRGRNDMIDRRWQVVPTWRRILSAAMWLGLALAIAIIVAVLLSR